MYNVKIVSDVSCPWCIIGYQALQQAIIDADLQEKVMIEWKPFELNPDMPPEGQDRLEHIQQKYGINTEQGDANRRNIIERGLDLGYEFSFPEKGRIYNTFSAHRLIHWAAEFGKQTQLKLSLFDLYFKEGGNPSSHNELLKCAESVGLDIQAASDVLNSDRFEDQVRNEQQWNSQNGITAVPAFIFDDKYLVSGGQPIDVFANVFKELSKQENQASQ